MIALGEEPSAGLQLKAEWQGSSSVGKRFTDSAGAIEVLVTKAGEGALSSAGERLLEKGAKPLPSSD